MFKRFMVFNFTVLLVAPLSLHADSSELVEVMLAAELDETRGYCLDIAGGKGKRAPLDKGLQAHTCYNYTGGILEDQGFDFEPMDNGRFRINYFDICMSVASVEKGAAIAIDKCNDAKTQKFELKQNGHLVTQVNPNLCITVNSSKKREGRGGSPVHVMRPLSLEMCDSAKTDYQTWKINKL